MLSLAQRCTDARIGSRRGLLHGGASVPQPQACRRLRPLQVHRAGHEKCSVQELRNSPGTVSLCIEYNLAFNELPD